MPRDVAARRRTSQENESVVSEEKKETRERVTKEGGTSSGWSNDRRPTSLKRTGNINRFAYEEGKETLIKILEAKPFAAFWQHWINKKPYICLETDTVNCPLCDIGDPPKSVDCFNIVEFTEAGPKLFVWICSANPAKAIRERSEKPRTSPVNRDDLYWAVSKSIPANGFAETNLDPVKSDDLKEDWGVDPLTSEQLAEFREKSYKEEDVKRTTPRHELVELANSLE